MRVRMATKGRRIKVGPKDPETAFLEYAMEFSYAAHPQVRAKPEWAEELHARFMLYVLQCQPWRRWNPKLAGMRTFVWRCAAMYARHVRGMDARKYQAHTRYVQSRGFQPVSDPSAPIERADDVAAVMECVTPAIAYRLDAYMRGDRSSGTLNGVARARQVLAG